MLYLLDANYAITANNSYYGIDQVPEFWDWLQHHGEAGSVKIPLEIMEEIKQGNVKKDLLYHWICRADVEAALLLAEAVDQSYVAHVVEAGYAPDLTDTELESIGRDAFLVAYALVNPSERCIVTTEVSKPTRTRQNRHLPDVCASLGVKCMGPFSFNRALGFKTGWKL